MFHVDFSQFLTSLQIDPSQLEPVPERLPEVLLEKCAAISVNPSAVDDLVGSMQCKWKTFTVFIFNLTYKYVVFRLSKVNSSKSG